MLSVHVSCNGDLSLTVADNGRGFDVNAAHTQGRSGGNGLRNMQRRAEELHGTLTVSSAPHHGTSITLRFSQ